MKNPYKKEEAMRAQKAKEEALAAKQEEDGLKCRKKREETKRKREAGNHQRQDMEAVIEASVQKIFKAEKIYKAARTIQKAWKGYSPFLAYQQTLTNICIVQCFFRCRRMKRCAAMIIQATHRGYCGRLAYQHLALAKSMELSNDPENSVNHVNAVIFTFVNTERPSTKFDVFKSAQLVWKNRFGDNLPNKMTTEINEGSGGRQLWSSCMMFKDNAGRTQTLSTKKGGFPLALDDLMVDLLNREGVAFTKKKIVRVALFWKIICYTQHWKGTN